MNNPKSVTKATINPAWSAPAGLRDGTAKTVALTNREFLEGVFGTDWQDAHICAFAQDPGSLDKMGLRHLWAGTKARDVGTLTQTEQPGFNSYYVVSTFKDLVSGRAVRRKSNFLATFCLTLDDIGPGKSAKVSWDRVLLEPSFVVETSPQNYQPGYILDAPETEAWRMDHLADELVRTGLADGGRDPGMKGRTRYVRLPNGHNSKGKYGPGGFKCRCVLWNPSLTYSVDQIADAYGIDMATAVQSGSGVVDTVDFDHDPWADVLAELGVVKSEHLGAGGEAILDITCPFVSEHTGQEDTGSAYMGDGRFYCHHSCGQKYENADFQAQVKSDLGAKFDDFWQGATSRAAKAEFPMVTGPTVQETKQAETAIARAWAGKQAWADRVKDHKGPPDFIIPQLVPRGILTALYGVDGTGKTTLMMLVGMALACGREILTNAGTTRPQRVWLLTGEDPERVLVDRYNRILAHMSPTPAEIALIEANFWCPDLSLADMAMTEPAGGARQGNVLSAFGKALAMLMGAERPDLVILDPISDLFTDNENDRGKVAPFLRKLNQIAARVDAAIMLLGHPSRAEGSDYSGSGAWSSKVRSRLLLEVPKENFPIMGHKKASWGKMHDEIPLAWENGVLYPITAQAVATAQSQNKTDIAKIILDGIKVMAGRGVVMSSSPNATTYLPKAMVREDVADDYTIAQIKEVMNDMLDAGHLATSVTFDGKPRPSGPTPPTIVQTNRTLKSGIWIAKDGSFDTPF